MKRFLSALVIVGTLLYVPTSTVAQQPSAPTDNTCGSAVSSCVLKASPGNLLGVYADCTAACWVMVFNSTAITGLAGSTVAGPGSGPGAAAGNMVECFNVAANDSRSLSYPVNARRFNTGITVAISSTACATLTLSAVGFISGTSF